MLDLEKLEQSDRTLVLDFTNAMRDLDTTTRLCSRTDSVQSINRRLDPHITKSFLALTGLEQSANSALRELAERAVRKDGGAIKELRKLGNLIKQFEIPAPRRKEWTSSQADSLNQ